MWLDTPCNRLNSCYDYPSFEETNMAFFNPEIGNEGGGLAPFCFSYYYLFEPEYSYEGKSDSKEAKWADYQRNCREWQAYLGGSIELDDIYEALYTGHPDDFLTALETGALGDFLPGNTFIRALSQPQNTAALAYFRFAKHFEYQQSGSGLDPWTEQYNFRDSSLLSGLENEARQGLATAKDSFLIRRWAYQRIILSYYSPTTTPVDTMRQLYQQHLGQYLASSAVAGWALLKIAEMNPDSVETDFQLAQVFHHCESKRRRIIQLFEGKSLPDALRFARTTDEKAALLLLHSIRNPGRCLPALKRFAVVTQESPYFLLLLTREVNKIENWLLTPRFTGEDGWRVEDTAPLYGNGEDYAAKMDRWRRINREKDRRYLREVATFLEQHIARRPSTHTLPALRLALAHLYYIDGQYRTAWQTLQHVSNRVKPIWKLQRNIQETLLIPHLQEVRRAKTQQKLYERLTFIRQNAALLTRPAMQLSRIYIALSHAFWQKKDVVTAGLLFGRGSEHTAILRDDCCGNQANAYDFYDCLANFSDLTALERLIDKKSKTPFEHFITQPYHPVEKGTHYYESDMPGIWTRPVLSPSQIADLKGIFAFRDGNLALAHREFSRVDTAYWDYTGIWKRDICGMPHLIASDTLPFLSGNTTQRIVEKMWRLETEARKNPAKRAENYYLLGNAWFHCSRWGYAGSLFGRYISYGDSDSPEPEQRSPLYFPMHPDPKRYGAVYYRCTRAAEYFKKALAASPDPELAARAFYMLAECDRRDRWTSRQGDSEGGVASPLFKRWAKLYSATETYRYQISTCPGLREYLGIK